MTLYCKSVMLVFVLGLAFPNSSVADGAPPPGFVKTCILEKQHYNGTECFECDGTYMGPAPADSEELDPHEDYGTCEEGSVYSSQGYDKICQSWGSSYWTEVWCKPSPGTVGPAGDAPSNDNSCTVVTPGIRPAHTTAMRLFRLLSTSGDL